MSSLDLLSMAFRNMLKRKLRTFLTVLGVIIGAAAIIIMISLGIGMNNTFMESLARMGDLMTVNVSMPWDGGSFRSGGMVVTTVGSGGTSNREEEFALDDAAIEAFRRLPGVATATPFIDISLMAVSGRYQTWVQVRGIDPAAMSALGYRTIEGSLLNGEERFEAVFGYEVPHNFFNPRDRDRTWDWWWPGSGEPDHRIPNVDVMDSRVQVSYDWSFGQTNLPPSETPRPRPMTLNTVGVLDWSGSHDHFIFMSIEDVARIQEAQQQFQNQQQNQTGTGGTAGGARRRDQRITYQNAVVRFSDIRYVEAGAQTIREMGYNAWGLAESLNEMQNMTGSMQMLLGPIGAVSLFVAALGISNTMIMSIYERTREIGVMKVIGASLKDIKRLFLVEAALIGMFGGLFGVAISLIISRVINTVGIPFFDMLVWGANESDISSIPLWLSLFALGFSAAIGLISGYLPARRATKLSALSAIRTE